MLAHADGRLFERALGEQLRGETRFQVSGTSTEMPRSSRIASRTASHIGGGTAFLTTKNPSFSNAKRIALASIRAKDATRGSGIYRRLRQ